LVKVHTGVFDPPPAALVVPWPYLAAVTGAALLATAVAAAGALRLTRRPAVAVLRSL
jgi:putative ABC transport system permease protein